MPGPTLDDVAREAGVSVATASRVINGSSRNVAESYRERVIDAARRLDYSPNASAQAVARGMSNTVTLVVPDISDPFFSAIAAGVLSEADERGLVVSIVVTERDQAKEAAAIRSLRVLRPRAIILCGSRFVDPLPSLVAELDAQRANGGSVVVVGEGGDDLPAVHIANHDGARALARELARLGYARVLVLGGRTDAVTARERVAGLRAGFADAGIDIPDADVIWSEFTREGARSAVHDLADARLASTELIAAVSDVMAIGAIAALRERGIDIPTDVAVTGFDDIEMARDVAPTLTTVALPLGEIGSRAVRLAVGDAADEPVTGQVVLRASTPPR